MNTKFKNYDNPTIYGMAVAFYSEWKKKPYSLTFKQIDTLAYICKQIGFPVRDTKCGVCVKTSCELVEKFIEEYDLNKKNYYVNGQISNYDPTNIYLGKSVLLIGNGKISKKLHAQKKNYDLVVGINQIYNSTNYKYVDIHYHALSKHDTEFLENYEEITKDKTVILKPKPFKVQIELVKKIIAEQSEVQLFNFDDKGLQEKIGNPLSGIWVLQDILDGQPRNIDIVGYDFYSTTNKDYKILPNNPKIDEDVHNLEKNKEYFDEILRVNEHITYYA
jgi:hypothetical protein